MSSPLTPNPAESRFQPPAKPEFLRHHRPRLELPRASRAGTGTVGAIAAPRPQLPAAAPAPTPRPATAIAAPADPRAALRRGVLQALPIVTGYLPVAFALGVLSAGAGLPFGATALMSAIVFAGSAQFVAVSLLAAAAPVWTIVATTFIINFRHFLMSTAMAPKFRGWSRMRRALFGCEMTDETFALLVNQLTLEPDTHPRHVFAVNVCAHVAWVTGTVVGYQASALLPDLKTFGIDFALPGMFVALIVLQLKDRWLAVAAGSGALSALALRCLGAGHLAVLIAAIAGASLAAGLESRAEARALTRPRETGPKVAATTAKEAAAPC